MEGENIIERDCEQSWSGESVTPIHLWKLTPPAEGIRLESLAVGELILCQIYMNTKFCNSMKFSVPNPYSEGGYSFKTNSLQLHSHCSLTFELNNGSGSGGVGFTFAHIEKLTWEFLR